MEVAAWETRPVTSPPTTVGLDSIVFHSSALAALAETQPTATPVPTCGEWTLADLTWHLGEVQDFWSYIITNRPAGPEDYRQPPRPDDDELADFLRDATHRLVAALDRADPSDAAWSWADDHTVAFTARRQTHEAIIHHVDGVLACASAVPEIDGYLAADGVDEMVSVMLTGTPEWGTFTREPGVVRLIATDAERVWTLRFGRMTGTSPASGKTYDLPAPEPVQSDVEVDTSIAASAWEMNRWLWGRGEDLTPSIEGDPELMARLRAVVTDATQ